MTEKTDYTALPLGKSVAYPETYDPSQLRPIARTTGRETLAIEPSRMCGSDLWNAYELSWLDANGKPQVACAQFVFPANTPNMVESKSFKLYLNSFNQSRFESPDSVQRILQGDLGGIAGGSPEVTLYLPEQWSQCFQVVDPQGECLDALEIGGLAPRPDPELLQFGEGRGSGKYFSNLFRSRCPVTGQPDWATVEIEIAGRQPEPATLLAYLLSYRNNDEFHEQCVERIFADILLAAEPEQLTVFARYTRRGGLDINPLRSTHLSHQTFNRLPRQ